VKGGGAGGRSSAAAGRASGSLVSHWSPGVAPEVTVEGAPPLYTRCREVGLKESGIARVEGGFAT
jgi:hypothetical protein